MYPIFGAGSPKKKMLGSAINACVCHTHTYVPQGAILREPFGERDVSTHTFMCIEELQLIHINKSRHSINDKCEAYGMPKSHVLCTM